MKSTFTIWNALTLLALLLPCLYLLAEWPQLPATVPTHFDANGQPNGYSSKAVLAVLVAGLPILLWLLMRYLPRFDPKRALDVANPNYQKLRLVVQLLLAAVGVFITYAATKHGLPASGSKWLSVSILLIMSLLGNYLTTVQPNYFVGIRTPWTLESPTVWAKTHRLGGQLFFWGGLLGAALTLVLPAAGLRVVMVLGLSLALGLTSYSYWLYQQEQQSRGRQAV